MFNSPILDVAIGLTFIYVLYSLLATTIKEFIATIFSYRGKMLERGIEQMLDGQNFKYYWYHHLWDKLFNKKGTNPSSSLKKKKELFARKIVCHPLYKRSADNRGTTRPSYLASGTFSDILLDILNPSQNPAILLKDIATEVNKIQKNDELKKILTLYLQQANGDVQRFKLLIENWYNDMMDRVSGWYKKQANKILLIIGFGLAVAFNINSIAIVKKLSADKTTRDALVKNAQDYVHDNAAKFGSTSKIPAAETQKDTTKGVKDITKKPDSTDAIADAKLRLKRMDSLYKDIAPDNKLLGLGWGDFGQSADSIKFWKDTSAVKAYNASLDDYNKHKTDKNYKGSEPEKPWRKGFFEKVGYIAYKSFFVYLLGFLITAFAISLGAPFWFDLLNKFINLRVSGAKPEDTTEGSSSKTMSLNQKPQPNSFA